MKLSGTENLLCIKNLLNNQEIGEEEKSDICRMVDVAFNFCFGFLTIAVFRNIIRVEMKKSVAAFRVSFFRN